MKDKNQIKAAYTIDEFCAAYRICRTTFYRLRKEKRLPPLRLINRKWLIGIEDAGKWFEELNNE